MKLSIIIPVYNEANFLRRCLDSVYANDEVEVIIVDDGSTDGSFEICQEYEDKGFKLIQNEHSGVSVARNTGIQLAEGEYITFLDSDDEMSKDGISNILTVITDLTDPMIQFNHYRVHGGVSSAKHKYINPNKYFDLRHLPEKYAVVWNKVYRKDFIDEHNIRFKVGQQWDEDRHFNYQCLAYCPIIYCVQSFTIVKYFENTESLCHTIDRDKLLVAAESLIDLLREGQPKDLEDVIRDNLANKWKSRNYKENFGGSK